MTQASLKALFLLGISQLSAASHVAWVAGPFGDCAAACGDHVQLRQVECKDVFTGQAADGCSGTRPLSHKACSCEVVSCPVQDPAPSCPDDSDAGASTEDDDDFE